MLGFLGFLGIPGLMAQNWKGSLWLLWFLWFAYFISAKNEGGEVKSNASENNPNFATPFAQGYGGSMKAPLDKLNEERAREKEANLARTLELFKSDNEVTNNDVERALAISNTSAERYLDELEERGKIEQVGNTGRAVIYKLKL